MLCKTRMYKKITAVILMTVFILSCCSYVMAETVSDGNDTGTNEAEPLVLSLKGLYDSTLSVYSVSLGLPLDENIGTIDLTLRYNPEVLEWFPTEIPAVMPTPHIDQLSNGRLHITEDCREYSRNWETIVSVAFWIRNGGDLQIDIEDAKVCDKSGNEMPLQIEKEFDKTEIVSDITWHYAEEEDCLYIGGKGMICNYYDEAFYDKTKSAVITPWHEVSSKAKKVVVEDGITEIGRNAFEEFTQLECIEIADSVVELSDYILDDDEMKGKIVLRGKAPGPVELYSNKGFQFEPTNKVLRGDLNDDGQLTSEDALRILQEAAKLEPKHLCTGDYNVDGQVTAEDALQILRVAAKLDAIRIRVEMMAGDTYTIDKIFDVGQYAWVYAELTPAGGLTIEKEVLPLPGDSPIGQTPEQVYTVSAEKAGVYELCFRLCPVNDPEADAVEERIYEITVKENSQTALELKKGETYVIDQIFDEGSFKWEYTVTPAEGLQVTREYKPLPEGVEFGWAEQVYTITAAEAGTYELRLHLQPVSGGAPVLIERLYTITVTE